MKPRFLIPALAGLLSSGTATLVVAQLAPPAPKPVIGARMPALSPDGKQIAFVYRGDVWVTATKGGRALPITQHVETDAYPLFSPDGKWIAFSSKRTGNWDIFVVPAEGGAPRRLTWHSGIDVAHGWSPDGKYLLFSSKRDSVNYALFTLDVATLRTQTLTEDYAVLNYPAFSPKGKQVVYGRYGLPWTRPRYHGSAAAQIWLLDLDGGSPRALTASDHQHLWTQFFPDGKTLLTVTCSETTPSTTNVNARVSRVVDNPRRTPNLWSIDPDGRRKQLTQFTGGAVRWPSVARHSGDIAFEYGPDVWLLKAGHKTPEKLAYFVASDEKENSRRAEKLTSGVVEAEASPDGKTIAFGLRGDIWTVLIEKPKGVAGRNAGIARRLTDWVGDDSDFNWSADGKKLRFVSDRKFTAGIYEVDVDSLQVKTLWHRNDDVTLLRGSRDGKHLAFWVSGAEGGLFVLSLDSGQSRRLVPVPGPHWHGTGGGEIEWSPDGRWLAYTRLGENRAWNIWIVPAAGGQPVNVTRLNATHTQPAWSPDGKYLFFQSNRDGDGLYVLPLTKEPARTDDVDIKFEKPAEPLKVGIDFDDIARRIRKVSSQNPTADLTVSAEGRIFFRSDKDLWSVSYDGKETKRLTTGTANSNFRISADGKKAYFIRSGELYKMGSSGSGEERIPFTADWERDVRAERQAAFTQFWRSYHRGFYDANFHGRDWEAIRRAYEPLLDAVETRDEFANLLGMMVGELEASHSEVSPATGEQRNAVTPHLGFTFDYRHSGPGLKVDKVPPGAPGSYVKTQIKPGEFVMAINGQEVSPTETLYELLNDKQDREFEFLVNDKAEKEGARKVKYRLLSQKEWDDLNQRNRIERLRKYVEAQSRDRVGYLHLSAMGGNDQAQFEREAYQYILGKEAMIIDVRFNRGGNIADTLIDWLERKPHGYFRPRDGQPEPAPARAWNKPMVVLMNEHSYSNGEMFPDAMRTRGLAKLVGMPTPGYVIWTSSMRLVDGTGARMPQSGVFRLDGSPQENQGEQPDYLVPLPPGDWLNDRDPQLDKAIELLLPKKEVPAGP